MAAPVYATSVEYNASPYGQATAGADIADRLFIASRDIDRLLVTAVYDVNVNDVPTDAEVAQALREATIAQASHGIDPSAGDEGDIPAGYSSVSIGSVSLTKDRAIGQVTTGGIAYAPRAPMILHAAGLLPSEPWMW